ncbi:MAG: Gfo/Idh/MocA family oxidoreductase [Alphaproteobacteria bacterium]|nr:Gfo/Idh/MocA family oxidoreductase [Alphaproteobacteria bacterium]
MDRVGIAFIGTGSIADYHLAGLNAVPRAELRAVVGRDAAKAASLAARHGVAAASTDLAATLARKDIAAVVIATPDDTHEAIAAQAAAAGKAILLQKPMATDATACRRILANTAAAGVDLQVSFMHRYFEEFLRARELVAAGAIGTVTSLRLRNATPGPDWADWFFKSARVGGGVVLQLGVHGIDLILQLCGPVARVSATTATLRPERVLADGRRVRVENPDSAWAVYTTASGVVASHEMSMIEAKGCDRFRLEIYGSEGTIWLRSEHGPLALWRAGTKTWETPVLPTPPFGQRQHRRWIDALLGDAPPEATARDALAGIEIAEAIARSQARGGQHVPVEAA